MATIVLAALLASSFHTYELIVRKTTVVVVQTAHWRDGRDGGTFEAGRTVYPKKLLGKVQACVAALQAHEPNGGEVYDEPDLTLRQFAIRQACQPLAGKGQ